ncbi:MAG: RIP metalloprotease RseP [Gemmatimonadales bacterium]|nr:MAG: RIP metalloprotease RseP [Gemmatimonadales bacterium]
MDHPPGGKGLRSCPAQMTILATLVVLGVLIFVHELGHFWAARSVGVRVERFSIGLGPRVYGFQRGDTEYVISAIPLGGYVKMAGMDDEVMEKIEGGKAPPHGSQADEAYPAAPAAPATLPGPESPRDSTGDFDSKPVWARVWVISAGVIMNFLFAFVAYTAVAGLWGSAEPDTLRVGDVRTELLAPGTSALSDVPIGAELTGIGARTPAHWGEVREALLDLPAGPVEIRFAAGAAAATGPQAGAVEITIPEDRADRIRVAQALEYWIDPVVGGIEPGTPASRAGLRTGDRILEVDGEAVERWFPFTRMIQDRPERASILLVERDGERLELEITPGSAQGEDPFTGEIRTIGRIGVLPEPPPTAWARLGPADAVVFGARQTWGITVFIVEFLGQLVTGQASPRNLGSIVTIGEISGQAAAAGLPEFLSFMALLSINLAILNLLPIPVLDGGHLVFLGLEAVRGRPVSVEQRMRWSQVGFVVLIGIMVLALGNDFMRLFGL